MNQVQDVINTAKDPLGFNIVGQCHALLHKIGQNIQNVQDRLDIEALLANPSNSTARKALSAISNLLVVPSLTLLVSDMFRPLLIDLCARWVDNDQLSNIDRFVALCLLVEPYEEIFPVLTAYMSRIALTNGPLAFISQEGLMLNEITVEHLQRILLAYYRLLAADPEAPARLGWSPYLLQAIHRPAPGSSSRPHLNRTVRWLALRCFGLQTRLPEVTRERLEIEFVGAYAVDPLPLCIGQELQLDPATDSTLVKDILINAWFFPIIELRRIQTKREEIMVQPAEEFFQGSDPRVKLTEDVLHPRIVNISGVLLYSHSTTSNRGRLTEYVPTATTTNALRTLALHVSQRIPTLLSAAPASGKMTLIRELASRVHPEGERGLVTLQLADTALDAKSLIGSYVSATTSEKSAGGFVWQDGALPRALLAGKWLVLADVDRASTEVLATLLPLVESMRAGKHIGELASLDLGGGRGRVQGSPSFMIFGMRSVIKIQTDKSSAYTQPTFFGHKHWFEVQLMPPTVDELVTIVERRFSGLSSAVSRAVVEFWQEMGATAQKSSKPRDVGMRDLEKFCRRLERALPPPSQGISFTQLFPNHVVREEILLEARDVFFAAYDANSPHFISLSTRAAQVLELDSERIDFTLGKRTPEYLIRKSGEFVVGRSQLSPKFIANSSTLPISKPFAIHRPALTLLESIAISVSNGESILLVGETGTGKTTSVQHTAELTRTPLVVLNLSNQSEASDLLGGFRPVDTRVPAGRLQETFMELFGVAFSRKKNKSFEDAVRAAYVGGKWARLVKLWKEAGKLACVDGPRGLADGTGENERDQAEGPRKRRKVGPEWDAFMRAVDEFDAGHVRGQSKFVFSFVEGPLVTALRNGHWVLLDEVNLASAETLECIASILQGPHGSVTLTEAGHLEPIPRHPDFRLFACMNPATDAGKRDLPPNIRSRFTELYVPPPDADEDALRSMVTQYIGHCALGDKAAITNVADFYIAAKRLTATRQLADGQNHVPHFSMRTLARALTFASDLMPTLGLRRALWEGVTMAFMMTLDAKSAETLRSTAEKHILAGVKNVLALFNQLVPPPEKDASRYIQIGPFWLLRGPEPLQSANEYILTPSVEAKLVDLARIVTTRRFPVLIEGPTSSGKTSSVEYLAKQTGHRFVRINNHEHTDLQEYVGSYLTDPTTGKLKFQDGILVRALRAGDWIVLDELNLAPTDVLEALNRLLDDNRELVIPETNEVIHPHPNFMLFATQNPPGLYAGRKVLSRAFRNRFLEVHFDDVPQDELETILCQRCKIAQSHGRKIVAVFRELQKRRQVGRVFETKNSFATLRDLFRWANRHSEGYTENSAGGNYQHLAEQGFMLLAERARRIDDRAVVKAVIEDVMKVKVDEKALYGLTRQRIGAPAPVESKMVWTSAMRRLFALVTTALQYNEPVLLVGETGSGKTSVCELFAFATSRSLHSLSCHQNTETADLLGSQRPLRNRTALRESAILEATRLLQRMNHIPPDMTPGDLDHTIQLVESALKSCSSDQSASLRQILLSLRRTTALFEWHDGPLIQAMQSGGLFLLDEISLADDSVLERLNSVLEPSRTIVLAEKGGNDISQLTVVATPGFQLVATMNPGGDYGKKELSPALRNRFTEIWVPHVAERGDLEQIIDHSWTDDSLRRYTSKLLDFAEFAGQVLKDQSALGLRDLLAWVHFSNSCASTTSISPDLVFHHAARLTIFDGLATFSSIAALPAPELRKISRTLEQSLNELVDLSPVDLASLNAIESSVLGSRLLVGSFSIELGKLAPSTRGFSLQAPTTLMNAARAVRALQIPKPLLLEGSPGVGKTSLIVALAAMSGHNLCRINLSDQTDLIDLFGSDMPVEGGNPGEFAWRDAAFLRAMQNGDWVLLDEMNLAPQAVLEGLNAVLDHRGTVFIPELGRNFTKHSDFRVFAAQNPLSQGGGRKGLPKSFINRFTKVYIEPLSRDDLQVICRLSEPDIPEDVLGEMLTFNERLCEEVVERARFGREGSPWEFNLRDIIRWTTLWKSPGLPSSRSPAEYLGDVYLSRFRSRNDQQSACALYEVTNVRNVSSQKTITIGVSQAQFGHTLSARGSNHTSIPSLALLRTQSADLEVVSKCINSGWLLILNGPSHAGKTCLIRTLATLQGADLQELYLNPGTDTSDLLGGFEHSNWELKLRQLSSRVHAFFDSELSVTGNLRNAMDALVKSLDSSSTHQMECSFSLLRDICTELANSSADGSMDIIADINKFLGEDFTSTGRFEWVDGPLVQAMQKGSWLVLDHCNLCNPAVLDRLNSLCETGGVLVLSERGNIDGEIPVVAPHPNFRLFMLLDPRHGELSRAMRNRGVEVSISPMDHPLDISRIRSCARLPKDQNVGQHSSIEDVAVVQLFRRGLIVPDLTACQFASTAALGSLTLAASDYRAFGSAHVLGLLSGLSKATISPRQWASVLLFLIASIPRESLHGLPHQLQALGFSLPDDLWTKILDHNLLGFCDDLRSRVGNQRGVSSRFLSSQPVLLHMNPNLMPAAFVPESYLESVVYESAWEIIIRAHLSPVLTPLTNVPTDNQLSILDKSRLMWGGLGAGITAPRCLRSISPLISALQTACVLSLGSSHVFKKQHILDSIQGISDCVDVLRTVAEASFVDYAAIRSLVRLVCEALNIPDFPKILFQEASAIANDLLQDTAINSGEAMLQIWTTMQLPALAQDSQRALSQLSTMLEQQPGVHQDVRRKALDIAAMLHLGDSSELVECALKLATVEGRPVVGSRSQFSDTDHMELCASALTIIADTLNGTLTTQLDEAFFDVVSDAPRDEWLSFAYLRMLVWEKEFSTGTTEQLARLPASPSTFSPSGYSLMIKKKCLDLAAFRNPLNTPYATRDVNLSQYHQYKEALQAQGAHLKLQAYSSSNDRIISLATVWVHSISLIFAAFGTDGTSAEQAHVADIQGQLSHLADRRLVCGSISRLVDLLRACSVSPLARVSEKYLTGLQNAVPSVQANDFELERFLGEAWIGAAYMLLELYFPEVPMDPLGGRNAQSLIWSSRLEWLHTHIHTLTLGQDLVHSAVYEPSISRLRDRLSTALDQHTQLKSSVVRGPEHLQQLTEIFTEVNSFLSQVTSHARISQLVRSIEKNIQARDFLQEEMLQGTITTFLHRLHENYSSLVDIVLPVEYALHQLKCGLRMHASAAQCRSGNQVLVSEVTRIMLYKPTVLGCHALLEYNLATLVATVPLSVSTAEWITAKARALLLSCDIDRTPHVAVRRLTELYDQLLHLWHTQEARNTRVEEESQSLYRQRKAESSGLREAEELEKEFEELFPSFGDIMDDTKATSLSVAPTIRSAGFVSNGDIQAIHEIHAAWVTLTSGSRTTALWLNSTYAHTCRAVTSRIAQNYEASLDSSIDVQGFCQRVQVTRASLDLFVPKKDSNFDFYHDANLAEVTKDSRLLDNFRTRLDTLIAEWPDQMVLRHLYERSQAISQLRLDTPLAKVLSALEQLLLHSDDWETYANKDNTLKVQQQELAGLIVDWRRLELRCWSTLLDREMSSCVESVSTWWPQLYESIVSVVAPLGGDLSKISSHLDQLVPLLDSYLTQSPLGQFESRLSLLQSFAKLTRSLSHDSTSSHFLAVSDLLDTLCTQYLEKLPSVQSSLAKQRSGVDKEISDFIKLASWKDTNVHALKQSAEKTHRVLHKCIRKFRSIIRQPVSEALASQPTSELHLHDDTPNPDTSSPVEIETSIITCFEAAPSSPLENIDIKLALQNYQLHVKQTGQWLVRNVGTEVARILAARIVDESKELSEAAIPTASDVREKHIKTLAAQKRRAWGDLLKELKRLGLAAAVTTDILSKQEDRVALLSLSLDTENGSPFSNAVLKSNKQFVKLLEVMPDMRASFHQHHSDISTRDFRRATNLVESSFSIVIEARKSLKHSLNAYNQVRVRLERMADVQMQLAGGSSIIGVGESFYRSVQHLRVTVGRICFTLAELLDDITGLEAVTQQSSISSATKDSVQHVVSEGTYILDAIVALETRALALSTPIWTDAEASVFARARKYVSDTKTTFAALVLESVNPPRLFQPVHVWLQSLEAPEEHSLVPRATDSLPPFADQIISRLLVGMQAIVSSRRDIPDGLPSDELPDKSIRAGSQHVQKSASVLGIEEIAQLVASLTENLAGMNEDQIKYSIDRLVPFLQQYLNLVQNSLVETLAWLNSISRLTYVLASTVRTLMQKGFCKPPDVQDESTGKEDGQELAEGTGMGEGAGAENISSQIEDEAQVEGLQGEQESNDKGERNKDDGEAIEMSEDFTGATEDVSEDEDDGEDDSKSGSEADPEERIEDLDSKKPNVVDEKLWNDESALDKPEGQDQAGDDGTTQPGEKSETAAKEDKPQKPATRNDDKTRESDKDQSGSEGGSATEEQGMEEDNQGDPNDGRNLDDFVPEANNLGLPDDLDLGQNDDTAGAEENQDSLDNEDEDTMMEDASLVDDLDDQQEGHDPAALPEPDLETIPTTDPEVTNDTDMSEEKENHAEAGLGNQDTGGGNAEDTETMEDGARSGQGLGKAQDADQNAADNANEDVLEGKETPEPDFKQTISVTETRKQEGSAEGNVGGRTRSQGVGQQQEQPSSKEVPNPLRSPADASKEIQRRVDQILNRQDVPQPDNELDGAEKPTEVEYADDDSKLDMQALGPSNDADEATKLRDLRINDVPAPILEETAADIEMVVDTASPPSQDHPRPDAKTNSLQAALTADEIQRSKSDRPSKDPEQPNMESTAEQSNEAPEFEHHVDSDSLEVAVAEWQAQGYPVEGAEEIWRLYESLTQDLSHNLCEQLRLILAPTRATRLRGDFRTGKRLNMKKLVPYVASDFTRDKIWLRRTRPAAREYQVLLAVDDSRSMARTSHTIHVTRQALALVSKALEKLEVGELGLARFGREVEVVHEFGAGVLRGGAALGKFTFDQPVTDVLRLIESSLDVLRSARERSSGSSDLWQLEIVISDGICQDHERLRTVLRRAEEERVMVVFVVIDAPAQNGSEESSIVSMLQPTIKTVNGRMDIQMERYLDSFPFRYFVVLRDVEALPDVLAGTLRQFFERISED
ncbi:hypothetical protein FRC07_013283 [Ceratobasidium sp. 392]|nr:hypothetical protein FRC07_013283 [Ceratobasidium sp. 392]